MDSVIEGKSGNNPHPRPIEVLYYAIGQICSIQFKSLLKCGWDANGTLLRDDVRVPILALALLEGAHRESIALLLEYHADPCSIPAELWFLDGLSSSSREEFVDQEKTAWCQTYHRTELARVLDMDFDTKCQFHRATEVQKLYNKPILTLLLNAPSVVHFPYKNIQQIGRGKTCEKVMYYLQPYLTMSFVSEKKQRPLVLLFIGPDRRSYVCFHYWTVTDIHVIKTILVRYDALPSFVRRQNQIEL